MFKCFSWIFFSWLSHRWPYIVGLTRFLSYFFTVVTIIFQCSVECTFAIEGNEIPKFGSSGLNFRNRLANIFIPTTYDRIQSRKFIQDFISKDNSSLCNSIFSVYTTSDISCKYYPQYCSGDFVKVVDDKINHSGISTRLAILAHHFYRYIHKQALTRFH